MHTCTVCGEHYDGDRCWVCLARQEDVFDAFRISLIVGAAGAVAIPLVAVGLYLPIDWNPWMFYLPFALSCAPIVIYAVVILQPKALRSVLLVRLIFLGSVLPIILTVLFSILNGALDEHPTVEAQGVVVAKDGASRSGYGLDVSFYWDQKQLFVRGLGVARKTYFAVEPGDSVRVVVHPGEFSQPWYGGLRVLDQPHETGRTPISPTQTH